VQLHLRRSFGLTGLTLGRASLRARPASHPGRATPIDRWCLSRLAQVARGVPVRFELWDGTSCAASDTDPVATLRVRTRRALWKLLRDPDLGFGEGYTDADLTVEGSLYTLVDETARVLARTRARGAWLVRRLVHRFGSSLDAARRNAWHHYDLGNDFYRMWLDDQLVYTCAFFPTPSASLEDAQLAKMERVCRKLDLQPGLRVFEAGCGWGALARHMAREHGCSVRAWNVSHAQVTDARARAGEQGLTGRVEFVEDDWRHIDGQCDAFVSVGMLEHVGPARYRQLGDVIDRCLDRQHGRGLLHFIGRDAEAAWSRWTRRYVFPGFYLPTLREVIANVLEPHHFSVIDVENLRRHYALTLEHWRDRFERVAPLVAQRYGERFARLWRYYLAGAHAGFAAGYLQLFQVAFAREDWDTAPWTRPV
jgi:cyclopropane-fatty-acyl-phospholipid synthase